jgi:hypothetical protein
MTTEICKLRYSKDNIYLLFVCNVHAVKQHFVNEQRVNFIIIHIITVLFVLHWLKAKRLKVQGMLLFILFP